MPRGCSGILGYYLILGQEPPGPIPPEPPTPPEPTIEVAPKKIFLTPGNMNMAFVDVITSDPDLDWEAF